MATPALLSEDAPPVAMSDSAVVVASDTKDEDATAGTLWWSEVFASPPSSGEAFSPARPMADKESLHGTGKLGNSGARKRNVCDIFFS